MPQGLQVWDENGVLTLTLSDRITKILGSGTASGGGGSFTDTRISMGTGFILPLRGPTTSRTEQYPLIRVSGNTVTWTSGNISVPFLYGIY